MIDLLKEPFYIHVTKEGIHDWRKQPDTDEVGKIRLAISKAIKAEQST